ncbi:PREDICTED: COMM domain-containing protein 1 [Charadrius vociferus]|uniref:COMM domain-containing protein 1 n=1 Tax=Charadrius vociferus TaxID=50402 RepID=UPI0005215B99|nr:PREDICTED: COMM domain-containing protein 1 [Charadrius vociferus]
MAGTGLGDVFSISLSRREGKPSYPCRKEDLPAGILRLEAYLSPVRPVNGVMGRGSDGLRREPGLGVREPFSFQSIASADMDLNQLEAFLTAQTKKQGGITADQAAVIAKFWKNHRVKIHESLINQSRWDNVLKNMNWRVDLKSQSRHIDQINAPVAIVEMELGKNGQESEFLCLEFDEAKVSQMLKKLSEIEESMTLLTQTT